MSAIAAPRPVLSLCAYRSARAFGLTARAPEYRRLAYVGDRLVLADGTEAVVVDQDNDRRFLLELAAGRAWIGRDEILLNATPRR